MSCKQVNKMKIDTKKMVIIVSPQIQTTVTNLTSNTNYSNKLNPLSLPRF